MSGNFDLLGDPIPENFGKRGRPPHMADDRKRNRVMVLQALGWKIEDIAASLSITKPTLKKHYFRELRGRDEAAFRVKAAHLEMVWEAAAGGNVAAMKEWRKIMDRAEVEGADRAARGEEAPAKRARTLGKKEQAAEDALQAGLGSEWGGDLQPDRMN